MAFQRSVECFSVSAPKHRSSKGQQRSTQSLPDGHQRFSRVLRKFRGSGKVETSSETVGFRIALVTFALFLAEVFTFLVAIRKCVLVQDLLHDVRYSRGQCCQSSLLVTLKCVVGQQSCFEIITPRSVHDAQVALSESCDLLRSTPAIFLQTVGWLLHFTALVMQDMAAMVFFSLRSLGRNEAIKMAISLFL